MRFARIALAVCCSTALLASRSTAAPPQARPGEIPLSAVNSPELSGRLPGHLAWAPDGRRLLYAWSEEKAKGASLWLLDVASGRRETLLTPADLAKAAKTEAAEAPALESVQWAPKGDALLLLAGGDLYLYTLASHDLRRLTETAAAEEDPKLSPDGTRVAFVRGSDLYLLDLATGRERALTANGQENVILNGKADWLYWEELWNRAATGFWWSPDSKRIAYYRFDESAVPAHPLVDESPSPGALKINWQKYPRPGEPNPLVQVGVLDLAQGESSRTVWMTTGEGDYYLPRVEWIPGGAGLAVLRLSREQNRLDLLRCSPTDGACAPLLTESSPTWINLSGGLHFLTDGSFLWSSEKSGWRRLYLHAADGRELRAVSPEGWAESSFDALSDDASARGGWAVFEAFETAGLGPADRKVLRVRLEEGGRTETLAGEPGSHDAVVAPRTGAFVDSWSDADHPPRMTLHTASGAAGPTLPQQAPKLDPEALPKWELRTVPGPDGLALPARILRPAGFDPKKKYPAIVYHYGGPASQIVANRWDGRSLWHKQMALRGFVVLSVEHPSSLFFGKAGEDRDFHHLGPAMLAGQLAGIDYLKSLGFVDMARVGLWGWSGGGFSTLYCLVHKPGVWKAAVAGAPVVDWRLYDSVWTERYLGQPATNPDGYRDSSPLYAAEQLKDHLLLVHGLADDNVHPENSILFSGRLIAAGIPFEEAFYPGQKHGFRPVSSAHFYARLGEFFERTLGEP